MNAEYFEKQRRDMLAAVRAMSDHMAAQTGKTALDERVLRAMAKVPVPVVNSIRLATVAESDDPPRDAGSLRDNF
jgi:hypothetical protein